MQTRIKHSGVEDIRFAPGWGNAKSNEYWTYAFLWYLDGTVIINKNILKITLKAYYTGFISRNIEPIKIPISNGTVNAKDSVVSEVRFEIPKNILMKNNLAVLNVIAANKWKRPIYFTTFFDDLGFGAYLRKDGLAYRFVPVAHSEINTDWMTDKLMNNFAAGNANIPGVYFDEPNRRQLLSIRNAYAELALDLTAKGRKEEAKTYLQKADKMMAEENFPYGHISSGNMHNRSSLVFLEACYRAGEKNLIAKVSQSVKNDLTQQIKFYNALEGNKAESMSFEKNTAEGLLDGLEKMEGMYVRRRGSEIRVRSR